MAAYRATRSFTTSRRIPGHAYGTASPIKCWYPYTPASPASLQPSHPALKLVSCPPPHGTMVQTQQPLLPTSTPVTRSLPENPTSDLALALPSLEHLTNALYAHAISQDATPRRHSSRSERHSRRDRRLPSCERRASILHHCHREAEHEVSQPAMTFETETSPRRKVHYVPATVSQATSPEAKRPTPPASLPTPPRSLPSSSPKQQHASPKPIPKMLPPPSPTMSVTEADAALSKFRRFVLAGRETAADDERIDQLIDSYDEIINNLVDEVVMDSGSESK